MPIQTVNQWEQKHSQPGMENTAEATVTLCAWTNYVCAVVGLLSGLSAINLCKIVLLIVLL